MRVMTQTKTDGDLAYLHDQMLRVYRSGYRAGRAFVDAELELRTVIAEEAADYWYFIAHNPGEQYRVVKEILTVQEILQTREERARQFEQWNGEERAALEKAKSMIWGGVDDVTIATTVGLFLPTISNLRSGALS